MEKISVVVPIHNEEENLQSLYGRLKAVLQKLPDMTHEIILVDDGSTDRSLEVIKSLAASDGAVKYLSFSRNFGHEPATTAGLDRAGGDCVVIIDGDLQDPPEVIEEMVKKWREGYHLVYAQRRSRAGESFFKKFSSSLFYRVINVISERKMPLDTGDFRLMDRKMVEAFREMGDYNRMVRGMVAWLGFRQTGIKYDRDERHAGVTKYGFLRLLWLSFDAVTSFSIIPLRVSAWIGFFITILSILAGGAVIYDKFFGTLNIPGYALLTVGVFFLGGVQLFILGIIGEYIGKIYQQVLCRPLYVVADEKGFQEAPPPACDRLENP